MEIPTPLRELAVMIEHFGEYIGRQVGLNIAVAMRLEALAVPEHDDGLVTKVGLVYEDSRPARKSKKRKTRALKPNFKRLDKLAKGR